jgi:U3 small nucleolar RNA-associated protein 10
MSQLTAQLALLRQHNPATPSSPSPSLLLDAQTVRSTSVDVLHTMALLGYDEIRKELTSEARHLAEELLAEAGKDTNRNTMGKENNKALSMKITGFLIALSPLLTNRGCQAVLEYLLHTYHIHIFEAEQLAVLFLQHWQHDSYSRLIANLRVLPAHLRFL